MRNGRVTVMYSRWNFDDPVTRERLQDEGHGGEGGVAGEGG
ncbi:hypothetical protein [Paenibacillus sp. UNC496MF]|nr:hypothetical protein [Paenibacillus sp. UNC496MF]